MYFNKIDDLIDNIIDDFFQKIIVNDKQYNKHKNEVNYIKKQNDINDTILSYIQTIPTDSITDIVKIGDNYNTIFNIIKKYIVLYLFVTIGIQFTGPPDVYINDVIKFTRDQHLFPLKINNFFNTNSNSLIIKLYYIGSNFLNILAKGTDSIKKENYYEETLDFINGLNLDKYRLKSLDNDSTIQTHLIVKTILIKIIYKTNDRKNLYNIIEQVELSNSEYTFIDIVETVAPIVNFNVIESLLTDSELAKGLAHKIWSFINSNNKNITMNNDDKINILINSGLIVPILDDFMIYHQNNETYIKNTGSLTDVHKEDTRLKYIINKIESAMDLYSETAKKNPTIKTNIMNIFSVPLYNKKAILRNDYENIKIINNFINQGKQNIANTEFFNDFTNYIQYPFINFRDIDIGFPHYFTQTVDAVRAVNFDRITEFKQTNMENYLQLRVGVKNTICNIVGFMIPTNIYSLKCVKLANVIDTQMLNKKNNIDAFFAYLRKSVIKKKLHKKSVYWLFNSKDFSNTESVIHPDVIKSKIGLLYDTLIKDVYFEIINQLDKHKNISINNAYTIINNIERSIIPLHTDMNDNIEQYIYINNIINLKINELIDNDILYGVEGNIIKLPHYNNTNTGLIKKIHINLANIDDSGQLIEDNIADGICQHNITWNNISKLKKNNYADYVRLFYNFIQQYVIEDIRGGFICKSCMLFLDIQEYVQEGSYDNDSGNIIFSMPLQTHLEDIPEYAKYIFSIKIIDKNIDKIASATGIPYFMGGSTNVKWRRKNIIKYIIDMVIANNQLLSNNLKTHNDNKTHLYGVSTTFSNLFVFDMENNIFQSSTKDIDQEFFKMIKRNNIMAYITIFMILELSEITISFFVTDKNNMCDIQIFEKVWLSLFKDLRIKQNNTKDTIELINYKLLCYVIYMISCRIAKHNLWQQQQQNNTNIKQRIPTIQKYIVHTTIDIINTILEHSYISGVSYIFEMFRIKFYAKLKKTFNNIDYYNFLLNQNKIITQQAKKESLENSIITNKDKFIYDTPKWSIIKPPVYLIPYLNNVDYKVTDITNITYCITGNRHKWKPDGNKFKCILCNLLLNDLTYSETSSKQIMNNYKYKLLEEYAKNICINGAHNFVIKDNNFICIKCNKQLEHKYTNDELLFVEQELNKFNIQRIENYIKNVNDIKEAQINENKYIDNVISKISADMMKFITEKNDKNNIINQHIYIDNIIDIMTHVVGNEIKGEHTINLKNNSYIINHDKNGYDIPTNIVITENDNKILFKANHPHFKTNVLYYSDNTGVRVDVFYDISTRTLIGYKELSHDYVDIINSKKKIIINYSIYNKLKLLGYPSEYININHYKDTTCSSTNIFPDILYTINNNRLTNLKNTLKIFQSVFNKTINNVIVTEIQHEQPSTKYVKIDKTQKNTIYIEQMDELVNKYKKKLNNVKIKDKNNKHSIFKHWKAVCQGIYTDKNTNMRDSDLIDVNILCKFDTSSNLLLFYIINELTKLLTYNNEGYIRTTICNFIIEFIENIFFKYNTDELYGDIHIKRFMHMITSVTYMKDINTLIGNEQPVGLYEEYVEEEEEATEEQIEQQIDEYEEDIALDLDMDAEDIEERSASMYDRLMD